MVAVRVDGMRDEMKKCITKETSGCKREKDLQEGGILRVVRSQGDEEKDEERGCTDGNRCQ